MFRFAPFLAALFLVGIGAYFTGMWTTHKDWAAWRWFDKTTNAARSLIRTGYILPDGTYTHRPTRMPSEPYVVVDKDKIAPGYVLINRNADPEPGYITDLIDTNDKVVHSWRIDYSKVIPGAEPAEFTHAVRPLPDGSLLVNFDDAMGMARLDACGDPVWTRTDKVFHHSLTEDPDKGGFWTWTAAKWDGGHDQQMTRIDAETGETLEEIDLIDDVIAPDPQAMLAFRVPEGFAWKRDAEPNDIIDIFHPNDVEVLPAAWADAFPDFEAGDLLVSFRVIDLVAVLDRKTGRMKWWQSGPWEHQHDPDFHPDGTITVYSNNTDRRRSSIIEQNMTTGATRDRFAGSPLYFDSHIMGQHEKLPNGNWLVAVPIEGRVVEVTDSGEPVRHISNVLDDTYNAIITTAVHVPPDFYQTLPKCTR